MSITMSLPSSSLRGFAATVTARRRDDVEMLRHCDAADGGCSLISGDWCFGALLARGGIKTSRITGW